MTALVGGLVAVALGLIGLGLWWREFLGLLAGGLPLILLLGGALAVYLGFEETKDRFVKKPETPVFLSIRLYQNQYFMNKELYEQIVLRSNNT